MQVDISDFEQQSQGRASFLDCKSAKWQTPQAIVTNTDPGKRLADPKSGSLSKIPIFKVCI